MRTALFMALLLLCFAPISANLVENQPTEYIQPNGAKLSLLVSGDEYYHRVHDENDYTILLHPETGYAVYAVPDGRSIAASNYVVGTVDPATLGIQPRLFLYDESIKERFQEQLQNANSGNRASPTGSFNNIVVFVRFSDQTEFPASTPIATYNNLFNSTTQQSLADYYDEVSQGQLDINSYLYSASGANVVSIQVSNDREYYSPYNATSNPDGYENVTQRNARESALIGELCALLDPLVPSSIDLDTDDDNINDALTFIFRGSTDSWGDLLWSSNVSWSGSQGTINGVPVRRYTKNFEAGLETSVICHEMGHMIGFPDLYHYSLDGLHPVRQWSLMANDNNQHQTTYEKWKYGTWFPTIPTITPSATPTTYTLTAIDQNPYSCYKIASSEPNQYYMLEYRRDTGRYESGIPASGLIIYRVMSSFGGSPVTGNRNGPPDEIYIYRPNGTITVNGVINNANYSSTVNRDAIYDSTNPEPWLYSSSNTSLDGSLVITDIGESGGTSITFKVRNSAPNVWNGSVSNAWNTASNWSLNSVPTNNQYVEIPNGLPNFPVVSTSTATCKDLTVKPGAYFTISVGTLRVITDVHIHGLLAMNDDAGKLYVGDDLFFHSGSSTYFAGQGQVYVTGDVEFLSGSHVEMHVGYLEFIGTSPSYLRCYQATSINHLRSNKTGSGIAISSDSTAPLTINGDFWTYAGSTSGHYSSQKIVIMGTLISFSGALVTFSSGTLSFEGAQDSGLFLVDTGNYVNDLKINKNGSGTVLLSATAAEVRGTLTIQSGVFNSASNTIILGGSWINNVGPTAFIEGTGTVILNGSGHQYMNYSEVFNALVIDKSGGALRVNSASANVICNSYTWMGGAVDVLNGTFTANDLAQPGIYGNFYVNSGGTINLTQGSDQWTDLNGHLYLNGGGTINVYGGIGDSYVAYSYAGGITMDSGNLWFHDGGLYFANRPFDLTLAVTGGTIHANGSFSDHRGGLIFSSGTVVLEGPGANAVTLGAGSRFYNLAIDKAGAPAAKSPQEPQTISYRGRSWTRDLRENSITANTNLQINGSLTIQSGTFDVNSQTITVYNDLEIWGTVKMITAGVLDVDGDIIWENTSSSNVSAGVIYCGGSWLFANGCEVDLTGSTTRIDSYYGGSLKSSSPTARFGNLEIYGTEEDPETHFNYGLDPGILLVNENLTVYGENTLNLRESDCTVSGDSIINETGTIQLGAGGTFTIAGDLELHGSLITGPGTALVHGLFQTYSSGSLLVDQGVFKNNAPWAAPYVVDLAGAVNITNGVFQISYKTLNMLSHANRTFYNAQVKVGKGFSAIANGSYHPTGDSGGLYQVGTGDPTLKVTGGNYLTNYYVQKNSDSDTVYLQDDISITGNITITSGKITANHHTMAVGGDIGVYGSLILTLDSVLKISNGKSISIYNRGVFFALGTGTRGILVTRNQVYGSYGFNVESGGTISAAYTTFKYMNSDGVNVKNGATVDLAHAFDYCSFQNGATSSKLLTVNNSQDITIDHASFPILGASGSYNLSKTQNQGTVTLTNSSGDFSGAAYEWDPNNRIFWGGESAAPITDLQIEVLGAANIRLWWSYAGPFTQFRIYSSDTPDGTFTLKASTDNMYWVGASANPRAFYKVAVVAP
ncbi:MAG: M6 family metalloprotease domain-containing protein [Candidatus Cloacimonetes bacterium]|jgi:M6 family metalloprotease-like protein|nr:M6 family metalloprotease domain-containing protein [Candidatus Cloacimonadota bacterium]MDY0171408.1 M6 family metalloprotease domain-containing protein [Candidatus Cloacimonadaceae bacterium]